MKKFKKMVLAGIVAVSLGASVYLVSPASAQGRGGFGPGAMWGNGGQFSQNGPILRDQMFQARLDILAELSGESKETLSAKLRYKPLWSILDNLKVDYKDFNAKMTEKRTQLINQAAADGKISEDQQKWMLERMEQMPAGGPRFNRGCGGNNQRGPMGQGRRGQRGPWGNGQGNSAVTQ